MEATPQDEHCVRPCDNRPKSKQKPLEDDTPNGPDPGSSSNSQDARHVAHVGHDAGEAEMNQLSRFQHLENIMKLTDTHVGLGQDSELICSDTDDGSDPDWSPDDDQNHKDITGAVREPPPLKKRRKLMIPYALRMTTVLPREMAYFSALRTLSLTRSMLMIVSQNM